MTRFPLFKYSNHALCFLFCFIMDCTVPIKMNTYYATYATDIKPVNMAASQVTFGYARFAYSGEPFSGSVQTTIFSNIDDSLIYLGKIDYSCRDLLVKLDTGYSNFYFISGKGPQKESFQTYDNNNHSLINHISQLPHGDMFSYLDSIKNVCILKDKIISISVSLFVHQERSGILIDSKEYDFSTKIFLKDTMTMPELENIKQGYKNAISAEEQKRGKILGTILLIAGIILGGLIALPLILD